MRLYILAAGIAFVGVGMLAGAAVIHHQKAESAPVAPLSPERGDRGADRGGDIWGASYFPNVELTTHEGETVRFFDDVVEGKVVAINFIYTWCPDTCPVETARLLQVARLLGDRLGEDVHFYSITIDPEYDTQPVLQAFAESWNLPEGWTLLTGSEENILRIREKLGMRLDDVRSGNLAEHGVTMLIGNQTTGRWMKRSPFENPYVLANQLGSWLHNWKEASVEKRSYEDAPELRQIFDGEYVFRNRCSACHTIGGGDLQDVARQHVGPDLFDVTRIRAREWLERWLMEPDAMIEEGDPLAVELYEAWNRIPMPNMRLTEKDVTMLLGYMEKESARIRAVRAGQIADHSGHQGGEHGGHEQHDGHEQHADHGNR
jgi:cytochrome oxidase Cu insertion factor (SCO1/SenC/PrrC family)